MMPTTQQQSRAGSRRTIRRVVIVAAALGVLGVFGGILHIANRVQRDRLINEARIAGLEAHDAGDYEAAIERLGYVRSRRENDAVVAFSLASAYSGRPDSTRQELVNAATLARRAWELDTELADAALLEIRLRGRLGQHTERLDAARRFLDAEPDNEQARRAAIEALASLGRREEALAAAVELTEVRPDDLTGHRTVLQLLTGLDPIESRRRMSEYAESLVEAHPTDPGFVILASQAFAQAGDLNRASEVASMVLEPSLVAALTTETLPSVVQLFDALAMREEASTLLESLDGSDALAETIAVIQIERRYKAGRTDLSRTIAAEALAEIDRPGDDLRLWAAVVGASPLPDPSGFENDYHGAVLEGMAAVAGDAPGTALASFQRALRERPTDPLALSGMASAHDRLGAWAEAQRLRTKALRTSPDFTVIRLSQIQSMLQRGEAAEATQIAMTGLRIDPSNGGLVLAYVMAVADLAEQGDTQTDDVRTALDAARGLDSEKLPGTEVSPASPLIARLLITRGDRAGAEAVIERILQTPTGTLNAHHVLALARSAEQAGLYLAGDLLAYVDRDPTLDASLLLDRATRLATRGDTRAGLDILDGAIEQAEPGSTRHGSIVLARAAYLDRVGDPGALDELRRLGRERHDDAVTQTLILESEAAWQDEGLIAEAVGHLRRLAGEGSAAWRVHEARRLQRFEPSEASSARAVVLLEPITLEAASYPTAYIVLAEAYRSLGDSAAAIGALQNAADAAGDRPGIHLRLMSLHQSRGEIDDALRRGRLVAEIEPVEPALRRERALALVGIGLAADAIKDADRLAATGESRDLVIAARVAAASGDRQRLDAWLKTLRTRRDLSGSVLVAASTLLAETGRQDDAMALIAANVPDGDTADSLRARSAAWSAAGMPERAIASMRDAYGRSKDADDLVILTRLLSSAGRLDEAKGLIESADPGQGSGSKLRLMSRALEAGDAAFAEGQPEAATKTLELVRRMLLEQADSETLISSYREITSSHPTYFPAWAMLIDLLSSTGRLEEAADAALTVSRLLPSDPRPARLAVELMIQLRPLSRAVTAARDWQRRSRPDTYLADTTLAALLIRLGRHDEAGPLIESWAERITADPSTPPVLLRLYAMRLVTSGRAAEARAIFDERAASDRRWEEHRVELARDLVRYADKPDAARRWIASYADDVWQDPSLAVRATQARIDLVARTARPDDQIAAVEAAAAARAVSTPATESTARLLDIEAHRLAGRHAEAMARAINAAERSPADTMTVAMLVQASADAADSLASAEAVAEVDPEDLLARIVAVNERMDSGSTPLTIRTLVLDALGRAHRLAGDPAAAEAAFRSVLAIDPDHTMARLGLAETFVDQGLASQARRVLNSPIFRDAMDKQPSLAPRLDRILRSLTIASVPVDEPIGE